jgi:capsule polysaccharide export protein KpsC/LpsZ
MSVSSFDLIDHAQAVATVTGSVGWEALNRNKPVLLFGHPWYRGCDGTFQIDSKQDCAEVLRKIIDGYRVDQSKLNMFAHAIEKVGIEGFVERHLRIFDVSDTENALLIGQALRNYWENVLIED